jgi:hypothetical protein
MLTKIRLELARDHEHPEGSHAIGYEFAAPLDANGKIDAAMSGTSGARTAAWCASGPARPTTSAT